MKILKRLIPNKLKSKLNQLLIDYCDGYSIKSYSQEGEDMVLRRIFENIDKGFYIDVGAHHPKRFSNTYYFYKNGWRGINIDARPGSMVDFNKTRPRDINIEAAIARERRELTYYMFDEPAVNSFDKELSYSDNRRNYKMIGEKTIFSQRLDELLPLYLPVGMKINFMTIDVEGLDLEVLESNDWQLLRPEYLLVECLQASLDDIKQDRVYKFLKTNNYMLFAKAVNTVIFKDTITVR